MLSHVSRSRRWESGVIACSLIAQCAVFSNTVYSSQPRPADAVGIAQTGEPSPVDLQTSIAQLKHALASLDAKQQPASLSLVRGFEELASLYEQVKQYNDAEFAYLKAIQIVESSRGTDDRDIIPIADSLASFYFRQNRYDDAEVFLRKWLSASEKNLPAQRANLAMALNNLGLLYKAEGRGPEAAAMLQRSLENATLAPEVSRPQLATIANRLAVFSFDEGRVEDAETYFQRAATAFEEGGAEHFNSAAAVRQNLALLYMRQHRFPEAVEASLKTLSLIAQTDEKDQGLYYEGLVTLASAYNEEHRYGDAEPLLVMAAETAGRDYPASDPRYAIACNNLGLIYRAMGRPDASAAWFERAVKAGEIAYGADHPWVASAALGLGVAYAELKDAAKAEPAFKHVIEIAMRRLGPDHLFLAAAYYDLSVFYANEHRFREAEPLLKQSLAIRVQKLGADHPVVLETGQSLSAVQAAMKKQEEAHAQPQSVSVSGANPLR